MRRFPRIAIAATVALVLLAACNDSGETATADAPTPDGETEARPAAQDLLAALETRPDFATLVSAIQSAGIGDDLLGQRAVTLFAPTNLAFDELPEDRLEQLIQLSSRGDLRAILAAHVVPRVLDRAAIDAAIEAGDGSAQFETLGGGTITVERQGDALTLTAPGGNRARLTAADIAASNGIVHGIDAVLQPQAVEEEEAVDGAPQ